MLSPKDEKELAEVVASTVSPLKIQGGGTRPIGNPVEGEPLTTSNISGITLYEPGALTLVAKAGTPVAEIEAALEAEGQMLSFEPMDHQTLLGTNGTPTIGGVVSANVSGPRRVQAGACRDSLIGVRFVDGRGDVISNGGRVMKNVTGYDLTKLMAGSLGTLGVLSEVSFKVLPKPEAAAVLLFADLTPNQAVAAMTTALGSPYEVTGAAHTSAGLDGSPVTMLRIEGFEDSVAYRAKKLVGLLKEFGAPLIERRMSGAESIASGWRWVRNAEMFETSETLWRINTPSTDAASLIKRLKENGAGRFLIDWGGGLIWIETPSELNVREHMASGHASLVKGKRETVSKWGVFHPEPAPLRALAEKLRGQFDPRGILNPGLMT